MLKSILFHNHSIKYWISRKYQYKYVKKSQKVNFIHFKAKKCCTSAQNLACFAAVIAPSYFLADAHAFATKHAINSFLPCIIFSYIQNAESHQLTLIYYR